MVFQLWVLVIMGCAMQLIEPYIIYKPVSCTKCRLYEVNRPISRLNVEEASDGEIVYNDNALERSMLFSLSFALAILSDKPLNALKKVRGTYEGFVDTSFEFMRNRQPSDLRIKLIGLLGAVIPGFVKSLFRNKYEKIPEVVIENSVMWFSFNFLRFLVGPAEPLTETSLMLTECRYLAQSGCKSACINLCKLPTQAFFNDVLGFPLTMNPDFTNSSCVFDFGVSPPPLDEDPALGGACLVDCRPRTEGMLGTRVKESGVEAYILEGDSIVRCS